jgi:hypothetical protein
MPAIEVFLPLPPSANNMFVTQIHRRANGVVYPKRVKSEEYQGWIKEAGYRPLAGEWRRITEDTSNRLRWVLFLTVYGLPEGADLSNRLKAAEDLVCAMTGLRDRYTREITLKREDGPHETLGACVQVWAATV